VFNVTEIYITPNARESGYIFLSLFEAMQDVSNMKIPMIQVPKMKWFGITVFYTTVNISFTNTETPLNPVRITPFQP
jgi:hypothetical protein